MDNVNRRLIVRMSFITSKKRGMLKSNTSLSSKVLTNK